MSNFRYYSKSFLWEFIHEYKKYPCLWQVKCDQYNNRNSRNSAYKVLVDKLREVKPEADKNDVLKKIKSLRTAFRREFKKVMESKRSDVSTNNVYTPRLWYYKFLLFTVDSETENKSRQWSQSIDNSYLQEQTIKEEINENLELQESIIISDDTFEEQPVLKQDPLGNFIDKSPNEVASTDELDTFGENVACRLRSMPSMQRLIAQRIINDTLFYGDMQKLTFTTRLHSF